MTKLHYLDFADKMREVNMKNNTLFVIASIFAMTIFLAACTREAGTPKNNLATAEETVKTYCELDADGVRLSSTTWSKVLPYISWTEEAGMDRAIVISDFQIKGSKKVSNSTEIVTIEYHVLGQVSGEYIPGRTTENVRFKVQRTDKGWKITEPDFLPPHVSAKAMAKHLKATKKNETAQKVMDEEKK